MKFKALSNIVTSKMGRQLLHVQKHSPTILFAAGVVGVVGTAVLASRATLKLDTVLDKAHEKLEQREVARTVEEYSETDYQTDGVTIYVQAAVEIAVLYGPAIIVGALSIAALTGSHMILSKRNASLAAAYAVLDQGFRRYRERVVKEFGIEKDREFRFDMQDRTIVVETDEGPVTKTIKQPGTSCDAPYAVVFDATNRNWVKAPGYNQMFLQCQQNYANDKLHAVGHLFLNEVYEMLGFPHTKAGAVVGWVMGNGDDFVDFGVFEGDRHSGMRFVTGEEPSVWLDFNVDGIIYDKI